MTTTDKQEGFVLDTCTLEFGKGPAEEQDSRARGMGRPATDALELQVTWNKKGLTALYDPGATRTLINKRITHEKSRSTGMSLVNIDGTINKEQLQEINGTLDIGTHTSEETILVRDIGRHEMVLGRDYIRKHNMTVEWADNGRDKVHFGEKCKGKCWEIEQPIQGKWDIEVNATESRSAQIAEKHQKPERTLEEIVPEGFHEYLDVFSETSAASLPQHKPYDCAIDLIPGKQPPKGGIYRLSPPEADELKKQLDSMLEKGWICRSTSPAGAGVMFAMKKDGKLRLCIDYRGLNNVTIKNSAVLPLIDEAIEALREAGWFCGLDVANAYHRIRIRKGDEWKTAFNTKYGHYEYLVMPFGLTNAPAIFQELMNDIFHDMIDITVIVYLDDIIVFGKTKEETIAATKKVLQRLRENHLYCKAKKCEFLVQEIDFLGFHISNKGVTMDQHKVMAIKEWPIPKNVKDIQTFMGFCNFYRKFIEGFSRICVPINHLLKKKIEWNWGEEQQTAFDTLKERFTTAPLLIWPNFNKPYVVEADASNFARGAILSQEVDGQLHPIAYISKSLTDPETKYDIWDKELLAIVKALQEWRHYLGGRKFKIITDHLNLKTYATRAIPKLRQQRWMGILDNYDYEIHYQPGKLSRPDALSRRPDHKKGEGANQEEPGIIPPERFIGFEAATITLTDTSLENLIEEKSAMDPEIKTIRENLENKDLPLDTRKTLQDYYTVGKTVIWKDKILVPNNDEIKKKILESRHDSVLAGHPGRYRTLELVQRHYHWPGMTKWINKYVDTCDKCQRTKTATSKQAGMLAPLPAPEGPWTDITYDLIVGLPKTSRGFDAILNVVDRLSKRGHFIPTTETIDAKGTADLFMNNVWKNHGLPLRTISDRGPQFNAIFLQELYKALQIEPNYSTAYHPQTDGQSERVNQYIEQYLRLYTSYQQDDWDRFLALAEFAYNNSENKTIGTTPFFADTGRHPNYSPRRLNPQGKEIPATKEYLEQRLRAEDDIRAAITTAGEHHKKHYDTKMLPAPKYQEGQKVWLTRIDPRTKIQAIKTQRPSQKLEDRKFGPYEIQQAYKNAYKLKLPPTMKIHNVFHESRLTPYQQDELGRIVPPPPPVVTEKGDEYEVKEILKSRWTKHKPPRFQYLVSWKGYDHSHNSWEPISNVENSKSLVLDFHKKYPNEPIPDQQA